MLGAIRDVALTGVFILRVDRCTGLLLHPRRSCSRAGPVSESGPILKPRTGATLGT